MSEESDIMCDSAVCKYNCCMGSRCGNSYLECNASAVFVACGLIVFCLVILLIYICYRITQYKRQRANTMKEIKLTSKSTGGSKEELIHIHDFIKENLKGTFNDESYLNKSNEMSTDNLGITKESFNNFARTYQLAEIQREIQPSEDSIKVDYTEIKAGEMKSEELPKTIEKEEDINIGFENSLDDPKEVIKEEPINIQIEVKPEVMSASVDQNEHKIVIPRDGKVNIPIITPL